MFLFFLVFCFCSFLVGGFKKQRFFCDHTKGCEDATPNSQAHLSGMNRAGVCVVLLEARVSRSQGATATKYSTHCLYTTTSKNWIGLRKGLRTGLVFASVCRLRETWRRILLIFSAGSKGIYFYWSKNTQRDVLGQATEQESP